VFGDLVQTTDGKWITHPPSRCPKGHPLCDGPGAIKTDQTVRCMDFV
jgi:hypothetical protein